MKWSIACLIWKHPTKILCRTRKDGILQCVCCGLG
uniref:Uncharacterized protein n=1 Tax=Rhizophora mucronata TaxID=61149 RepID=A0A2P2KVN7_RHIMU